MDGDASTAIHLAYYAELRAAMSFLASEGIAVLKNEHYWFDSAGKCHPMQKLGTHDIVWKLLTAWADEPSRSARLLQLFVVNGENFGAWLQAAGYSPGSPTTTELAKDWLKTWSLDLQTLPDDRTLRNEVSYRPQRLIHAVPRSNFVVMLRIIMSYWQATEPTASARFEQLDLFLLRYTLERAYRGRTGQRPRGGPYERFIETTLSALGMSPSSAIVDFLGRRQATRNHPLLGEARKKGQKSNSDVRPFAVIARALLLLRLASAATNDLLQEHAITKADLTFWWTELGEDNGLWKPGSQPIQMTDLWGDVGPYMDVLETWCDANVVPGNLYQARTDPTLELWRFTQFQRAGLWAIGL